MNKAIIILLISVMNTILYIFSKKLIDLKKRPKQSRPAAISTIVVIIFVLYTLLNTNSFVER
jgi:putative effector of murein hydrolase